ncbi:hypothetical protein [Serratia fonticola]|uniref:Acetyltransferase n=1 Tax=Serratia fonticola TaxID=47917 RepID=A0AAW3WKL8_SERFO|nr:hypothetical protein [Serratia fonticola]MBC3211046.1 hypothetical protein [Serratia fonticola]NYA12028.1 hypothetical protein [Serratia fonticola]NYA31607.1 hypothetical protein [Serratia fonticola]
MMRLKKMVLDIVAGEGNDGGVLFEAPPQGNPRISEAHAAQLDELCGHVQARTRSVTSITCSPHRVGQHNCVAVKLVGATGCINLLLTITGTLRWPTQQDYAQAPRWYINLSDAVDVVYLVTQLAERLDIKSD